MKIRVRSRPLTWLLLLVVGALMVIRPGLSGNRTAVAEPRAQDTPGRAGQPTGDNGPPPVIPDFRLRDTQQKEVGLADFRDKPLVVVVFVGVECPLANAYLVRLTDLHREFSSRGVQFLAINSNSQDSLEQIGEQAGKYKLPFPLLKDPGQKVADLFRAKRTPEAFVLDRGRTVRYRGRIDDQWGVGTRRPLPTRRDLAVALQELLAGKAVSNPWSKVAGCYIGRDSRGASDGPVTYSKHIAGILQRHCQECHRPGQVGPFSLLSYEQARAWSQTIREVVTSRQMPPWHADPRYGKFANDRSLNEQDRTALLTWIEQGCPKGDNPGATPPTGNQDEGGWAIGRPDAILSMKEPFKVPAEAPPGGVPWQDFPVPTNFDQDIWIQRIEVKPGCPAVVHHMGVFVGYPMGEAKLQHEDFNDLIVGVPGGWSVTFPDGMAKKLPKGAELVFTLHYEPNGTEQWDRSSIGIIFSKEPPQKEVRTRFIANTQFAIPPAVPEHQVVASTTFRRDSVLLNFFPHMHLRGKQFEYRAVYPDGRSEILISIPRYDFSWQTTYWLAEPLPVPAGTKVVCTASFDNSSTNPNNPDPTKSVRWGQRSEDEMMVGHIDFYYDHEETRWESAKIWLEDHCALTMDVASITLAAAGLLFTTVGSFYGRHRLKWTGWSLGTIGLMCFFTASKFL